MLVALQLIFSNLFFAGIIINRVLLFFRRDEREKEIR